MTQKGPRRMMEKKKKRYLQGVPNESPPPPKKKVKLTTRASILRPTNKVPKQKIKTASPPTKVAPKGKVLRKKFSWKNYPELEDFLIANREEYLRHSAMNYTMQQKEYNNRLTERLLDLASECGYIFDEEAFSFVSVRDRIRCYFKSYVQSRKKRGVIIGYAARRAGLLTEEELEKSAATKGKIVVPAHSKH